MEEENLYEILEIESNATSSEIKRAYRKLALKYHPDKVSEDERESSEIQFKKVSYAYEILIDEEKRYNYDQFGSADPQASYASNPFEQFYGGNFNEFGGNDFHDFFNGGGDSRNGGNRTHRQRTEDAHIKVEVTLEDLYLGKVIRTTSTRNIICTQCKGSGLRSSNAVSKQCGICHGEGHTRKIKRVAPGLVAQEYVDCTTCNGTGKIYRTRDRCKLCSGTRIIEETKILEFEIQKGSPNIGQIVKKGESDEFPGKQAGDIILDYTCKTHEWFERKGDDLYSSFKLPLAEALTGFTKQVTVHLDGRSIQINVPAGKVIRPGNYIKLAGEGMPKASKSWFSSKKSGDLYLKPEIEFPRDNWYLEKNDLLKIRNILPSSAEKLDLGPEANIDLFTDFTTISEDELPTYESEQDKYDNRYQDQDQDPQCTQQ